ncbi:MAG: hypothetical protein J2P50_04250 [Hyphomicrobiaceae bacterium]|nr:hypothetical protein [Hyphomicrobiaceae bacterium]
MTTALAKSQHDVRVGAYPPERAAATNRLSLIGMADPLRAGARERAFIGVPGQTMRPPGAGIGLLALLQRQAADARLAPQ